MGVEMNRMVLSGPVEKQHDLGFTKSIPEIQKIIKGRKKTRDEITWKALTEDQERNEC